MATVGVGIVPSRSVCIAESSQNEAEAQYCTETAQRLLRENRGIRIAILTPYEAQVQLLTKLRDHSSAWKICTIDGYQGQEADVVILSLVKQGTALAEMLAYCSASENAPFVEDRNRFNVAVSRAIVSCTL